MPLLLENWSIKAGTTKASVGLQLQCMMGSCITQQLYYQLISMKRNSLFHFLLSCPRKWDITLHQMGDSTASNK